MVTGLLQTKAILREQLPILADRYGVSELGIFGSRIRADHREDSDLDVLVSFRSVPGLLRLVEMENYLSDLLGVKVDLVLRDSLKPQIGKQILNEVIPV